MRIAILSDVHSNLAALEAVLKDAERRGPLDGVWGLGDLVGYGPQPSECLARLRAYDFLGVAGNHDLAVVGAIDTEEFNPAAATANHWNAERLSEEEKGFLSGLPLTLTADGLALAHGSLRAPVWEYMITMPAALAQFERMATPYSIVGHTHVPLVFREVEAQELPEYWRPEHEESVALADRRLILNPGSVGQPRDGDPRASYAIYDSAEGWITFVRVAYDIRRTQRIMREAKLPARLIERLAKGR